MTTDLSQLSAGPELDALVATEVMGWRHERIGPNGERWFYDRFVDDTKSTHILACDYTPSTDHNAAALVTAKLVEWGWTVGSAVNAKYTFAHVGNDDWPGIQVYGKTQCEAICKLAVLVARERDKQSGK